MSKFLKIFVALAAIAAIATPAFALEADFGGFLQIRGIAFEDLDGNEDIDDEARGVDSRFRLYNTNQITENVKVVFKLEVDYHWGDTGVGDPGADAKSVIEVKNIYMDFDLPALETNVKAGTHFYKLGRGILLFDDNSGLSIRKAFTPDLNLGLYWVKSVEGPDVHITGGTDPSGPGVGVFDDSDDQDYYHVQLDFENLGGAWHVGPYVAYAEFGDEDDSYYVGVDVDGKLGDLGLAFTAIYNDWEDDIANTDGNGYVLYGKGTYKAGATTLSLEAASYGDEDNATGSFRSVRSYNNFAEIVTGGKFDGRGTVGSNQTVTASSVAAPYQANWTYAKLGAAHKYNDKNKVSAYYIYAKQAEGAKLDMGHEVDAYYDYTIDKGLTFTVGGGYLFADDEFGAGDDAWKAGTALTAKF